MTSTLIRIGNSHGLILPAKLLKRLSISEKDALEIRECDGGIVLSKSGSKPVRTPFSVLDEWKEANGYAEDDSVEEGLAYVESLRRERVDNEIKLW